MPSGIDDQQVLYIVACAAPPAQQVDELVRAAQRGGWRVCVIATPSALAFLDVPMLETLTGYPIRSAYKQPSEADSLPPAQAIAVAPATFNTMNKWASGIGDTLALGLLTEAIGKRLPVVALPFLNRAQAAHPAFEQSVQRLRAWGVRVLYGSNILELHEPDGSRSTRLNADLSRTKLRRDRTARRFTASPLRQVHVHRVTGSPRAPSLRPNCSRRSRRSVGGMSSHPIRTDGCTLSTRANSSITDSRSSRRSPRSTFDTQLSDRPSRPASTSCEMPRRRRKRAIRCPIEQSGSTATATTPY